MSSLEDREERARGSRVAALLLVVFVLVHGSALGVLQHNVDEGSNVYGARVIQEGGAPFRDFFYQQPPLHLYVLALLPTDHFVHGRALSLLAAAASGLLIFWLARPWTGATSRGPLLALGLFSTAGLQYFDLLAMPTSLMLASALLAVWILAAQPSRAWRSALAGVVLAASVCFKPLAIAVYPAVVAWLLVEKRYTHLLLFTAGAGALGLLAWAAFDLASDGAFTELVRMQSQRLGSGSQVDVLRQVPGMREWVGSAGPRGLSLRMHMETLWHPGNLLVGAAGLPGLVVLWRSKGVALAWKTLWSVWLASSLFFAFFVWDVAYHHYHVLYLPPLAMTGALLLEALAARLAGRPVVRGVVAGFVGVGMLLGVISTQGARQDYSQVTALRGESRALMAFDATVNVLSRTAVGCGVSQFPLPPYGPVLSGEKASFPASVRQLIGCLEADPSIGIVIHQLSVLSMVCIDPVLHRYIRMQPEERILYVGDGARDAFQSLQ